MPLLSKTLCAIFRDVTSIAHARIEDHGVDSSTARSGNEDGQLCMKFEKSPPSSNPENAAPNM